MSHTPDPSILSDRTENEADTVSDPMDGRRSEPQPRPRRFWRRPRLRISLRVFLVLAPVIAFTSGTLIHRWYQDHQYQKAVEELTAAGATLFRDDADRIVRVYVTGEKITDEWLEEFADHLNRLPHLEELDLVETQVTDEGLAGLANIGRLRTLYVHQSQVTAEGIADLARSRPDMEIFETHPDPIATGLAARDVFDHAILKVAFDANGEYLATGSGDGMLRVFRMTDFEMVFHLQAHEDWTFTAAFHPTAPLLATGGGDDLIRIWSLSSGKMIDEWRGHDDDVHAIAYSPSGHRLYSSSDDMTVGIWDTATGEMLHQAEGHEDTIPSLALSPDGTILATGSRDATIRTWDVETGAPRLVLDGHSEDVMALSFDKDGHRLASASYDKTIRIWDLESAETVDVIRQHDDWVFAVAFAQDDRYLVSGGGDGVSVYDFSDGRSRRAPRQENVSSVAVHPDGLHVATASATGNVALRQLPAGRVVDVVWTRYGERGLRDWPRG